MDRHSKRSSARMALIQNASKDARVGEEPVIASLVADEIRAALSAADDADATPAERAEMLMEIAMGLQLQPKSPDQLHSAVTLYDKALTVCPEDMRLLRARILARKATALQAIP